MEGSTQPIPFSEIRQLNGLVAFWCPNRKCVYVWASGAVGRGQKSAELAESSEAEQSPKT